MQRVCVFCGSQVGNRPAYAEQARRLGKALVAHGLGLVFGAGHIGLMGILADAVLEVGGEAIGVIPQALVDRELAHTGLTQLHITKTMHDRKAIMADLADGFIAIPGGYGTCDELFEILTWAQLGLHTKPIGLLNFECFFDPLLAWLDHAVEETFIKRRHRDLLLVETEPKRLLERMADHRRGAETPKCIVEGVR